MISVETLVEKLHSPKLQFYFPAVSIFAMMIAYADCVTYAACQTKHS
jgi:hypothetical protein